MQCICLYVCVVFFLLSNCRAKWNFHIWLLFLSHIRPTCIFWHTNNFNTNDWFWQQLRWNIINWMFPLHFHILLYISLTFSERKRRGLKWKTIEHEERERHQKHCTQKKQILQKAETITNVVGEFFRWERERETKNRWKRINLFKLFDCYFVNLMQFVVIILLVRIFYLFFYVAFVVTIITGFAWFLFGSFCFSFFLFLLFFVSRFLFCPDEQSNKISSRWYGS